MFKMSMRLLFFPPTIVRLFSANEVFLRFPLHSNQALEVRDLRNDDRKSRPPPSLPHHPCIFKNERRFCVSHSKNRLVFQMHHKSTLTQAILQSGLNINEEEKQEFCILMSFCLYQCVRFILHFGIFHCHKRSLFSM